PLSHRVSGNRQAAEVSTSTWTDSNAKIKSIDPRGEIVHLQNTFQLAVRNKQLGLTVGIGRDLVGVVFHDHALVGECVIVAVLKWPEPVPGVGIGLSIGLARHPLGMCPPQGSVECGPATTCENAVQGNQLTASVIPI